MSRIFNGWLVVLLTLVFLGVSGCIPVAVLGVGTLATTTLAEERGVSGTVSDSAIRSGVNAAWLKNKSSLLTQVEISVREGRVLLTGHVDKAEDAVEAIRLAWTVSGVSEVIDRIQVGKGGGFGGYIGDSWITTKLKTSFLTDSEISSINYTVKTVDDVVYIMGIAQTQKELDKVIKIARETRGVKKVVTFVRVKDSDPKTQKTSQPSQAESPGDSNESENPDISADDDLAPVQLGPTPDKPELKQ